MNHSWVNVRSRSRCSKLRELYVGGDVIGSSELDEALLRHDWGKVDQCSTCGDFRIAVKSWDPPFKFFLTVYLDSKWAESPRRTAGACIRDGRRER